MTDIVPSFQNVFDGTENVFRRSRNLRQLFYMIIFPLILENLDLCFLIHSNIPGFRTGKLWKIIWHSSDISFLYCSMTSDFTNAKTGLPLTGFYNYGMSVFCISDAAQPYFFIILTTKISEPDLSGAFFSFY